MNLCTSSVFSGKFVLQYRLQLNGFQVRSSVCKFNRILILQISIHKYTMFQKTYSKGKVLYDSYNKIQYKDFYQHFIFVNFWTISFFFSNFFREFI